MDTVNLATLNSSSFVFSRDLSPWADVLPLTSGKVRAHMRLSVTDPVVYYEWSSDNRRAAYSQTKANGQLTFASNPSPGDTIELGYSSVQFLTAGPSSHTVILGATSAVTLTLGNPGIVNWATHGLVAGTPVQWTSTGNLPSPLAVGTIYYVSCGTGGNVITAGT